MRKEREEYVLLMKMSSHNEEERKSSWKGKITKEPPNPLALTAATLSFLLTINLSEHSIEVRC
jgi:hypothetical protein